MACVTLKKVFLIILGIFVLLFGSFVILIAGLKLFIIKILHRLCTGQKFDNLLAVDATCQYLGTNSRTAPNSSTSEYYIHKVLLMNGIPDILKLRQIFQDQLIDAKKFPNGPKLFPRLTDLVVQKWNYFIWVPDKNFNISNHIRVNDVSYADESSLLEVLMNISYLPLPPERSPWEIIIIPKIANTSAENLQTLNNDNYALILKFHHCLCDGLLLVKMLNSLADKDQREHERGE